MKEDIKKHIEMVAKEIRKHGYCMKHVHPRQDSPPYNYTIGLSITYGHPELVITGVLKFDAARIVLQFVADIRNGRRFTPGQIVEDIFTLPLALIQVPRQWILKDMSLAAMVNQDPFTALQIITPDKGGRFPWDLDADMDYHSTQPIVGLPPKTGFRRDITGTA